MIMTCEFEGKYEIINASLALRCNLFIYSLDKHNLNYSEYTYKFVVLKANPDIFNQFIPTIIIGWINSKYF